jgi:hypothetical protein
MMYRSNFARLALAACLLAAAAGWQQALAQPEDQKIEQRLTPQQLHETGLDTLSAAQLARLNELLQQQAASEHVQALAEAQKQATPYTGEDRGADPYLGIDQKPITTRLKGSISHWEPGTEFQLENGQTWKVLKGSMKLRKPLEAPVVILVPGFAGRWFLQVDEDLPKARVYRID